MGTTANYSWPYPESSDFVADGATAIENLADAIDTSAANWGKWTAYTPTFTNLTIGNGTVNFRYTRLNNLVTVSGSITWGTTTTSAGSNFIASLPVTAANTLGIGAARYFETGVGSYLGVVQLNDVLTMTWVQDDVTNFFGLVNINGPFAWGTGDIHSFTLTYEAQ